MATKTKKKKQPKQRDPLPEYFDSLEECAEFWDTHDSADYEEYFTEVEFEVDLKVRSLQLSVDSDIYKKVRAIAKEKGLPTDKLVKRWIEEKVRSAA